MALTEAEYQTLIITEIGDDDAGTLAATVPLYWSRRSGVADLESRYLVTKRDAIVLMLGTVRDLVDMSSGGDSVKLSQKLSNLRTLLELLDEQIAQAAGASGAAAAAGELTQTAPILPPTGSFDSNAGVYRGSPYQSRRRRP